MDTESQFVQMVFESRAVLRPVTEGNIGSCALCGIGIKFAAKRDQQQVIANVYEGRKWSRVEYFHPSCYEDADQPYGQAM